MTTGPLAGLRVVELASIGPGPHAGMQLADLGADVVRVMRPDTPASGYASGLFSLRGRTSLVADLKQPDDRAMVVELIGLSDVFTEGLRPGTTERLGLDADDLPEQNDRSAWPRLAQIFAEVLRTRTRDEWAEHFAGSDACVTPVLTFTEAPAHPHAVAHGFLVDSDAGVTAAPAPRFSRSRPSWTSGPSGSIEKIRGVVDRWAVTS